MATSKKIKEGQRTQWPQVKRSKESVLLLIFLLVAIVLSVLLLIFLLVAIVLSVLLLIFLLVVIVLSVLL
jgi:uncharacterized membrane protein